MNSIRIVLVRPKYARNVGMVARAMSNYGLQHLIVIDPQCSIDQDAHEGAAQGQGPLEKIQIYPSWQRFYDWEHEGVRIAFSRREGKNRESFEFSTRLKQDQNFVDTMKNKITYFIFGPEDHGLSDDDLDFVHCLAYLDVPGPVQSMNLSHAVLSALTLCHHFVTEKQKLPEIKETEHFFFPDQTLRRWLEALNIDITTHSKVNAHTVLKRLLLKGIPNQKELHLLETVMQQTIRKLMDRPARKKERSPETSTPS